jgi:hypothetical protein
MWAEQWHHAGNVSVWLTDEKETAALDMSVFRETSFDISVKKSSWDPYGLLSEKNVTRDIWEARSRIIANGAWTRSSNSLELWNNFNSYVSIEIAIDRNKKL